LYKVGERLRDCRTETGLQCAWTSVVLLLFLSVAGKTATR
jgi:hypothetical protein